MGGDNGIPVPGLAVLISTGATKESHAGFSHVLKLRYDEWTDFASQHYVSCYAVLSHKEDHILIERRPFASLSSHNPTCSSPRERAREEISRVFPSMPYIEKVSPLPPSHRICA
ncbi:hypothetical protein DSL72_008524 [Monilinia vaccinii-corymbosi]|uniref:Uncharacterized protein n=1 Tax=Monilinia vaccinii-corymbosi TaxID=61207 RepID=A0A8A3PL19_9HELO|nr:hypothetical protein DSL72_008524 [Monilinia vaccinii-corymbosi]